MNKKEVIHEVWFCLPKCWADYNQYRFNERFKETISLGLGSLKKFNVNIN